MNQYLSNLRHKYYIKLKKLALSMFKNLQNGEKENKKNKLRIVTFIFLYLLPKSTNFSLYP